MGCSACEQARKRREHTVQKKIYNPFRQVYEGEVEVKKIVNDKKEEEKK